MPRGAQTLDGDLTLDAKGDPNAIFIIQIDAALSTNALSRILLINSASFCNVFWQINGAVDLGKNSIFRGNIVANGAISLLDSAQLDGRALSRAGAISTLNNLMVGCDSNGAALPVLLMHFNAEIIQDKVYLRWATASEINNDNFIVQRTKDGRVIEDIIRVKGFGNSSIIHNYLAIDNQPLEGTTYYRLKQTDFDGTISYSDYVASRFNRIGDINIYPNPFYNSANITINDLSVLADCELIVYNVYGKEILKETIRDKTTILQADKFWSGGVYIFNIISQDQIVFTGRVMLIK